MRGPEMGGGLCCSKSCLCSRWCSSERWTPWVCQSMANLHVCGREDLGGI